MAWARPAACRKIRRRPRRPAIAFAVLGAVAATLGIQPTQAAAKPASIIAIRSEQSALPESIRREAYAAIARSRATLLALRNREKLWTRSDGSSTVFPLLAFCDPEPGSYAETFAESLTASLRKTEQTVSKPWSPADAAEAAYAGLAQVLNTENPIPRRIESRLTRTPLSSLEDDDAALLLMALESNGSPKDGGWQTVVNNLRDANETEVAPVALAALGRLLSRHDDVGKPGNDVLAHTRWIARRLSLGSADGFDGKSDPLTPEAAFFVAVFASRLPRRMLAEDRSLFPYDWRNHVANRLIAQQRKDPATGRDYWDCASSPSPDSDSALRATTYAVMTLVLLAE